MRFAVDLLDRVKAVETAYANGPVPHTHTISNVTGLQDALTAAGGGGPHTHPISDINGLQGALDAKVPTNDARLTDARTPTSHGHVVGEISGLQTALDSKANSSALSGYVQTSDPRLSDPRTPTAHNHDAAYYTKAEITALLAGISGGGGFQFPVDSVYISFSSANPATYFNYGTWTSVGAGRMLVNVDAGDPAMDAAGDTGGAKTHTLTIPEMPTHGHIQNAHTHLQDAHTHIQNAHGHNVVGSNTAGTSGTSFTRGAGTQVAALAVANATAVNQNATAVNQNATATNQDTGGGQPHNNMPPYVAVHIWRRTA